jgi:hypothetical protein
VQCQPTPLLLLLLVVLLRRLWLVRRLARLLQH